MSTLTYEASPSERLSRDVVGEPGRARRISWGAIFAGTMIVLGVQLLLSMLGLGIGLGMVEPTQGGTPSASSLGIGAAIWWGMCYLVALVAGGYVAARLASAGDSFDGMLHGLVTWAVTLIVTFYLLTSAVGSVIGGAFNIVGSTLSVAGEGIKSAAPHVAQAAGLSADQLQQRAKDLLSASPSNADPARMDGEQAQREIVALLPKLAGGGDQAAEARDRITAIMAAQLNISKEEATTRLNQLQVQIDQTKSQVTDVAKQTADTAATGLSRAALIAFVTLLLGAGAAGLGGKLAFQPRLLIRRNAIG